MKKLRILLLLVIVSLSNSFSQELNEIYSKAFQAYLAKDYAKAAQYFSSFRKEYLLKDELLASAIYYQGESYANSGQVDEAITSYTFLINNFLFSNLRNKVYYKNALLYYEKSKYESARQYFLKLNAEYPNSEFYGSTLYWIGETYAHHNNVEEAVNYFKEAISYKQTNKYIDNTIYSLARTYEEIGDYTNAVTYYDELLSFYRESPLASQAQIRIGICYFHLKEYDSSILELSNPIVRQLPVEKQTEALYLLANSHYRVGEYANAEKVYREVIEKYPASSFIREVKYAYAWSIFQQKKYADAYKVFNALSADDDSIGVKSFYWKGEAKRYSGNEREALLIYEDFLQKNSESELVSSALYQIGVINYTKGDIDKAGAALSKGVNTKDNEVRGKILTMLGEIELQKKKYQSALQYFSRVNEREIEDEQLVFRGLLGKGIALFYLNKYNDAVSVLSDIDFRAPNFESAKVSFYLAECFFSQKNITEALNYYNKVSTEDAALQALTMYGKAYCYFNQKDYTNASNFFSDFVKKYPKSEKIFDARIRMADSYFADKNYDAASNAYEDLLKLKNGIRAKDYVSFQYALALYRAGKVQKAIEQLDNFKGNYSKSIYYENVLYLSGWISFQQNNFYGAIYKYTNMLETLPNSKLAPLVQYSIGDAYYNLGNYDSAIVAYESVISNYSNSPQVFDALNGLQYCYVAKGEMDKAVQIIDNFVSENPTSPYADQLYFKKGELYYNQRDYEKARLSYKDFITYFSKSKYVASAYYQIGKCEQYLNNLDEAIQNYKVVFNSYPQSEIAQSAVIELGNLYNQLKRFDQALTLYDKATVQYRSSSRIAELLFMKGDTYLKKNNLAEAYDVFEEISMYYASNIFADKAKLEMGLIELTKKRFENADKLFLDLFTRRTDDIAAKAQYSYGVSLLEQDKTQNAITAFVRVLNVYQLYDEWVVKSYLKLGDAYLLINDKNKAKEMFRTVIASHRGDEYGKEAQRKLRNIK
ncbi:MAG: tetratricopeptide repeat protein [Ignavibacteriaceae bacterium]|jgi:TolA-binding protein